MVFFSSLFTTKNSAKICLERKEKEEGRGGEWGLQVLLLSTLTFVYRHYKLASSDARYFKMRRLLIDDFKWISCVISEAITTDTEKSRENGEDWWTVLLGFRWCLLHNHSICNLNQPRPMSHIMCPRFIQQRFKKYLQSQIIRCKYCLTV